MYGVTGLGITLLQKIITLTPLQRFQLYARNMVFFYKPHTTIYCIVDAKLVRTLHVITAVFQENGREKKYTAFDTQEKAFQAYKKTKEAHIQEMATKYYKDGKINEKVYNALMNYKVEITD